MAKKVTAPITTAMKTDTNQEFAPRADILLVVSCTNTNPNGDPDDEGRPRTDLDNYGIISAGSLKRKVRDTVEDYNDESVGFFDDPEHNKIFVQKQSVRTQQIANTLDFTGRDTLKKAVTAKDSPSKKEEGKKESIVVSREDRAYAATELCKQFLDVRMFGQVLGTIGAIDGAVQFEHAFSVNTVDIEDMGITSSQVANGVEAKTKDRTMGRNSRVKFALYPICIHVNGIRARKNGFTRADYERMLAILAEMFDNTNASGRTIQFENMYIFEHESLRGNMPLKAFRKAITFDVKTDTPKSMDDIEVNIHRDIIDSYQGIKFIEK